MNKERLVAFTDAIVAIAATIMVLELAVPATSDWRGLMEELPTLTAYIISFFMIYVTWLYHHNLFEVAKRITVRAYLLNGLWIFFLTLVPFLTAWVGSDPGAFLAEFLYTFDMLLWSISFLLLDLQVIRDNPGSREARSGFVFERIVMFSSYFVIPILTWFIPRVGLYGIGVLSFFLLARTVILSARQEKASE